MGRPSSPRAAPRRRRDAPGEAAAASRLCPEAAPRGCPSSVSGRLPGRRPPEGRPRAGVSQWLRPLASSRRARRWYRCRSARGRCRVPAPGSASSEGLWASANVMKQTSSIERSSSRRRILLAKGQSRQSIRMAAGVCYTPRTTRCRLQRGRALGPYEIVSPLGAGGMGEVYRARDTRLGRDVAIKVLAADLTGSPQAAARFEREWQVVAHLSHPNILSLSRRRPARRIHVCRHGAGSW